MSETLAAKEDLGHIFRAMERGTRRSRLRVGQVVCQHDHTLLDLYRGTSGRLWGIGPTSNYAKGYDRGLADKVWHAYLIELSQDGRTDYIDDLWCRCGWADRGWISVAQVLDGLSAGNRRVVAQWIHPNSVEDQPYGVAQSELLGMRTRAVL